jgi:hypothetical protein
MSDDKSKVGLADRDRINVNEDYELRYWSNKLGCSADDLRAAAKAVGPSVKAVEQRIQNKGKAKR